jgi:hypothetical protein
MVQPTLSISSENVCYLIVKAREFDVQDVETDPDSGSNPTDDKMVSVLETHADDPTLAEIRTFIDALSEEDQIDLVALMRLGRDEGMLEDWPEVRAEAARQHNERTADYLLGEPLLPDHLEEGLSQFGFSCAEFEMGRL